MIPVPEEVSRVAAAALTTRQERGGGGSARGVVIATALTTGYLTDHELDELRAWHAENPQACRDDASTLLGGMYGGAQARAEWPPQSATEPEPEPQAMTAAADITAIMSGKLAKLSAEIARTDRDLRLRLHAAAALAYREALRSAEVKMHTRARTKAARAALEGAAGRFTPAILAAVGVTEAELLDRRFDTLAATTAGWIAAAERRKLTATRRALGVTVDQDRLDEQIDQRAEAAGAYLAGALGLLARAALSGHAPEPTQGEVAGPVPFRLIRSTWNVGATGTATPNLTETGPGPADTGKLTTLERGKTIPEELLGTADVPIRATSTWSHGDPDRPFEPHEALDGLEWVEGEEPPELLADPGEFPFVDQYAPDDHEGCTCEVVTTLDLAVDAMSESL